MPKLETAPDIKIFRLVELSSAWEMSGKIFSGKAIVPERLAKDAGVLEPQIQVFDKPLRNEFSAVSVYPDFVRVLINDRAEYFVCSPVSFNGQCTHPQDGIEIRSEEGIHEVLKAFHSSGPLSSSAFIPVKPIEILDHVPAAFDPVIHPYYQNIYG